MDELGLDVGQANELKLAFRRHGYTNEYIKRLTEGRMLAEVLEVLKGFRTIAYISGPAVNCDVDPRIPSGMVKIKRHDKQGAIMWEPYSFLTFYPIPDGESSVHFSGTRLLKELEGKPVMNACMKDFLLANPHLVPHEWLRPTDKIYNRSKKLYFPGTIFRDENRRDWMSGLEFRDGTIRETLEPVIGGDFWSYWCWVLLRPQQL